GCWLWPSTSATASCWPLGERRKSAYSAGPPTVPTRAPARSIHTSSEVAALLVYARMPVCDADIAAEKLLDPATDETMAVGSPTCASRCHSNGATMTAPSDT